LESSPKVETGFLSQDLQLEILQAGVFGNPITDIQGLRRTPPADGNIQHKALPP
jgi:hypothetical protein